MKLVHRNRAELYCRVFRCHCGNGGPKESYMSSEMMKLIDIIVAGTSSLSSSSIDQSHKEARCQLS